MKHKEKVTRLAVLALITFGYHISANAQETKKVSMSDAIAMSIQNSGRMKIANAKVNEANASYREAKDNRLPDIKATGSYLRVNSPNINLKIKTSSSQANGEESSGTPKVDQAAYGLVNATLPLFSGLRIKSNIEASRYLEQAAKYDAENEREQVIKQTIDAYSNLYKAKKSVELVKENLIREEKRVVDFSNLEQNGLLARNDLLKAQLQQSNIELSLLEAENNLKIATINLNLMLGMDENTILEADTTGMEIMGDPGKITQWEQIAMEQRKDRAALSARINAANLAIKATKGEYYPSIALTGGYIAANVPNLLILNNALNAGIGLQYNLGALWKTGAKVDGAKARLHQIQASAEMLTDQVRLEIHHAYQAYVLSVQKIGVYKKSIEQANENYRITKRKYDNNLVTTTELLEADIAQLQSELNYAFSKADAMVAYKKLQQTAGVLN